MFGTDVLILELVGFLLRILENSIQTRTQMNVCLPLNLGEFRHNCRQIRCENLNIGAKLLQNRQDNAIFLLNECPKEMFGCKLGVPFLLRMRLRRLQRLLAFQRKLVESNHASLHLERIGESPACGDPPQDLLHL
jgi:hypothetical protein